MLGAMGVNSSSHVSAASTQSCSCNAASPNGHVICPVSSAICAGSLHMASITQCTHSKVILLRMRVDASVKLLSSVAPVYPIARTAASGFETQLSAVQAQVMIERTLCALQAHTDALRTRPRASMW